jgi:hypothetical protein
MINDTNLVIVTTTIPNNVISEKRRTNIVNNFSSYKIPIIFNQGIKNKTIDNKDIMAIIVNNAIKKYKETNLDYGIICDDDFCPSENFLEDLNKTVALLPSNWRSLHLCPGYLWGRATRDKTKIGHLNPEYNMDGIPYHESGRFYMNCNNQIYIRRHFWLGGPIAVLLNKKSVDHFNQHFITQYRHLVKKLNNDVVFTLMLTPYDFICREPMLGYENEEGGSTFS